MKYQGPIPDRLHKRKNSFIVTKEQDFTITDHSIGKTFETRINIVEMNSGVDENGYLKGKSIGEIPLEIIENILKHSDLKSHCSQLGEILNQKLLSFLIQYFPDSRKNELMDKDFMNLRNEFREIIKKDERFYDVTRLQTANSRKTIRRHFTNFIEDRNIYTHGSLQYRTNDSKVLIKYIDKPNKEFTYSEISLDIMNSYEELYNLLNKILIDMRNQLTKTRIKENESEKNKN